MSEQYATNETTQRHEDHNEPTTDKLRFELAKLESTFI